MTTYRTADQHFKDEPAEKYLEDEYRETWNALPSYIQEELRTAQDERVTQRQLDALLRAPHLRTVVVSASGDGHGPGARLRPSFARWARAQQIVTEGS